MKGSKATFYSISVGLIIAFALTGCAGSQYKEAKELMDSGSYEEAAAIFATITDYQDSGELYKSCIYSQAKELMDGGSYSEASDLFDSIKEYQDAAEQYSSCMYSLGQSYMQNNNYTEAKSCFESIPEYKDSSELIDECDHVIAVKNDTTPPVITGMSDGEVIEVEFNSDYNLQEYVKNVIKISDDVSGEIEDYKIKTDAEIYDPDNGKIDTLKDGTYDFSITAADEADNKASVAFSVHVDALLRITKENEFPVVLYDGELGKYKLNSLVHYSNWLDSPELTNGYYFEIEIDNQSDADEVAAFIGHGYLNDYRVPVKSDQSLLIASGKKGFMNSFIDEDDLDENTEDFEKIECQFFIEDDHGEKMFARSLLIDRDVFEFR